MNPKQIKATIDRLVAESIRRQLPEIMNEVLVKTIANSGVVTERRAPAPTPRKPTGMPMSLRHLVDESIGADHYYAQDDDEPGPQLTRRLTEIPNFDPQLASLMEDVDPIDPNDADSDGGLDISGLDFSGVKRTLALVESVGKPKQLDAATKLEFEERRLKGIRDRLDGKA